MYFKNKFFLFFILFFILFYFRVNALQITKVSGSPASRQWIEIYNDTNNDIKITDFKIKDTSGSNRTINITSLSNNTIISPKTYIIIHEDGTDESNIKSFYNGIGNGCNMFRVSTSFTVEPNKDISIIDASSNIINSFNVLSLQELNNTSCSQNQNNSTTTNATSTNATSTNITSTTTSSSTIISNTVYVYVAVNNQMKYGDINVLLPEERVVPALADVDYTVKAIDSNKNAIANLNFDWSFGDGGERFGKDVKYHYVYPGEYTLIATADGYTSGGQAVMKVNVIHPEIYILKVGTSTKENFIDIKNNTNYDLFLSNFYLKIDNEFYKLPKNFIIAKNKTVHISGDALGFKLPAFNVSLHYPNKNLLTTFEKSIDFTLSISTNILNNNISSSSVFISDASSSRRNLKNIVYNNKNNILENNNQYKNNVRNIKVEKEIYIKKLVLNNINLGEYKYKNTNKTTVNDIEKERDKEYVDIRLINFFKSLLY